MMKGRKVKHNEEALKPKAKGKVSGRISRVKKGVQDRKEQEAIAAMDRDRDTQLLENAREVDVAVPPEVDGRGVLEGAKTDDLGIGGWEEEGPWWTNVVDDQEVSWGWGSAWLPYWDLEFSAEPCESLNAHSHVAWDDHLWNFDVDTRVTHPR